MVELSRIPDIPPVGLEDYEWFYGRGIDYVDKTVLDIGADVGSTASFFFKKGAKKVIAVDSSPECVQQMTETFKNVPELIPIQKDIQKHEDFEELILKYKPDIFKADCEFCEMSFRLSPPDIIKTVPVYLMETHNSRIHQIFCDIFESLDYKKTFDANWVNDIWMTHWIRE